MRNLVLLTIVMFLILGCSDGYLQCRNDCLRYMQNCSTEGSFCIPPCNVNHTCTNLDMTGCIDKCN